MRIPRARALGPRRLLTRAGVARLFEVSPATVARWSRQGKLPFVRTPGGQRRYVRAHVAVLVAEERPRSDAGHTARTPGDGTRASADDPSGASAEGPDR